MSEDWKPGDWAICINSDGWQLRGSSSRYPGPEHGQVMQVEGVWVHCFPEGVFECLVFGPWPNDSFHAVYFVKVSPGHQIEGDEIEREAFAKGNPWRVPV